MLAAFGAACGYIDYVGFEVLFSRGAHAATAFSFMAAWYLLMPNTMAWQARR